MNRLSNGINSKYLIERAFVVAPLLVALVYGCASSGCLENGTTLPLAGLYSAETGEAIAIDSLEVRGLGAPDDSVLLAPTRGTSTVYLPFRAETESVSYIFSFSIEALDFPQIYDTITFDYNSIPYLASADCGAMYIYRLNRLVYTTHLIDSVGITDSLFTNIDRQQIHIYYRTGTEDDQQ